MKSLENNRKLREKRKEYDKRYILRHRMEERTCIICGKKFRVIKGKSKHPNSKFLRKTCSEECRKIYRRNYHRNWEKTHPERVKAKIKEFQQNRKFSVLAIYSKGKPKCACCGESHIEFLTIDHIHGDGAEHRGKIFKKYGKAGRRIGGYTFYSWLIKNGFPEGFRVLCMNCNFSLGHYGYCPHNLMVKKQKPLYRRPPIKIQKVETKNGKKVRNNK